MAFIKWSGATDRGTALTTELDALAAGSRSNAGSEIANQTNKDKYAVLELTVDFVSAPAAGGFVRIYMVVAPDGTNYEDGSSSVDPGAHKVVRTIPVRADTAAQRLTSVPFLLSPYKTKFLLTNDTSQAFPASGSQVKLYTWNDEG